ncbi:MAG: alanine racemase [Actinobacteria bacterium]|nr:alanine racemase [Actinomycetota bacterium]
MVKGNGYGFGRVRLAEIAGAWAPDEVAVGTVHELADVCAAITSPATTVLSLTPAMHLPADLPARSVVTVGAVEHVAALERAGVARPVAVKLESTMRRHGTDAAGLAHLVHRIVAAGLEIREYVLHLPLPSDSYTDDRAVAEIEHWLPQLDPAFSVSLSHLPVDAYRSLCEAHPHRSFGLRAGTALWHGDKSALHLSADVLDVRPVEAGEPVGYRQAPAPDAVEWR